MDWQVGIQPSRLEKGSLCMSADPNVFETANAGFAQVMYEEFLRDPASVGPEWRRLFESGIVGMDGQADGRSAGQMDREGTGQDARSLTTEAGNGSPSRPTSETPTVRPSDRPATRPSGLATPITGPAARLVANMADSLTVPTATTFRELPVTILENRRRELNNALKTAGRPEKVSFTHLIGYALAQAAHKHPVMTTVFVEVDGAPHKVVSGQVNLGLAVDVERKDGSRGLVVPVIHNSAAKPFAEFHAVYEQLVEKARGNKLMPDAFAGATITLTNPGGLGTVASVPRLMAGQGSIIAVGSIGYPPSFSDLSDDKLRELGISKVMTLTSTYDHRVIQGAESGEFLRSVEGCCRARIDSTSVCSRA
jgi:pyruvate/2-oxoglutarate dehydrogenase complex dihydrolipoamide acyltransferase (E2) component